MKCVHSASLHGECISMFYGCDELRYDDCMYAKKEEKPVNRMMRWFTYSHLSDDDMRAVSEECASLASYLNRTIPEGPEKTAGMRKLLEAKDCFVRAVIEGRDEPRP